MSEEKTVEDVSKEDVSRETTLLDTAMDTPPPSEKKEETTSERPPWLHEKFGKPEDLAKAYDELSSKISAKETDYRARFEKELETKLNESRPAKPSDYKINEETQKLLDMGAVPDNKLINWWAEPAHKKGMNHEQFNEGINMYLEQISEIIPTVEDEKKKLGENADARIESVSLFANKYFDENTLPIVQSVASTADGIKMLEYIQEKSKDMQISSNDSVTSVTNEDELKQLMLSEEYWNRSKRNPEVVKKVEDGYKRLYK